MGLVSDSAGMDPLPNRDVRVRDQDPIPVELAIRAGEMLK
jgi:hypothetical protein